MLIDGGEDISVLYEISKYMGYEDMNIEVVVLTHPHSDHLGGLLSICEV
jgi:competence protein ComEC